MPTCGDTMYSGIYHGSVKHQPDIDAVFINIYAYIFTPDIGANMCDTMYSGIYHGSVKHQTDIDGVFINIYAYFTRYRCQHV